MKPLLYLILLGALCVSNILAQTRGGRELPVIADRLTDIGKEMSRKAKSHSPAFLDDDAGWNAGHGNLHCTGPVYSIVSKGKQYYPEEPVYIGGGFDSIDGLTLRGIALLDNGIFTEIGGGVSGGDVYAICSLGDTIYIGGNFKKAGEVSVNNIAMWDGTEWRGLGSGTDSTVLALRLHNGKLYVGGNFRTVGGAEANFIASWDQHTAQWSPVFSEGVNGMDGGVATFESAENYLIAGGGFVNAGKTLANKIAVYSDNTWKAYSGGVQGPNSFIADIHLEHPYGFYVTGSFNLAGTVAASNVAEHFDSWSAMGSGLNGPGYAITSLLKSGNYIAVTGDFTLAGGTPANNIAWQSGFGGWKPIGSGILGGPGYALLGEVYFVAFQMSFGNPIYVGGAFTSAGSKASDNFAIYYFVSQSVSNNSQSISYTISPNPTSSVFTINSQTPISAVTLSDALGRIIEQRKEPSVMHEFNVEMLPVGMYWCIAEADDVKTVARILVTH